MRKNINNKAIFWDYDTAKMNLNNPQVRIWRLNRKLQFGDLRGIKKDNLKKLLPQLDIDFSLKELLSNFLSKYG